MYVYINVICSFSERPCTPLSISNSNITGISGVFKDKLHCYCDSGYAIAQYIYTTPVTCLADGNWEDVKCLCKEYFLRYLLFTPHTLRLFILCFNIYIYMPKQFSNLS